MAAANAYLLWKAFLLDRLLIKQPRLRRFLTRLIEGQSVQDVSLLGTRICVDSIKENGYLRASRFANRASLFRDEAAVIVNLAALLQDGDTFVDIGANVGIYSLTLARMQRILPRTGFYAFEANPDTFARLRPKAEALGVKAYNLALSDHCGTLEFVGGAVSHVFTTVPNISGYSIADARVSVPCRRLDEMEIEGDSIVLKIDVEGQEREVLEGAKGLFAASRIKAVYLDGYKEKEVESFLKGHGLTLLDGTTLQPTQGNLFGLLAVRNPRADG